MKKHGLSGTPSYSTWKSMVSRCTDPRNASFNFYGLIGISVCREWLEFEKFITDMGARPEGMTLDRIDSAKGYFKENCRWATLHQQNTNRKSNVNITHNGQTKTLTDWARTYGIAKERLHARLKAGWPFQHAISTTAKRGFRPNFLTMKETA